jgi:hypothetical protein
MNADSKRSKKKKSAQIRVDLRQRGYRWAKGEEGAGQLLFRGWTRRNADSKTKKEEKNPRKSALIRGKEVRVVE